MAGNVSSTRPRSPERLFKYATAEVATIMVGTLTARWSSPLIFDDPHDARCDWRHFFHVDGDLTEDALAIVRPLIESRNALPATMSAALRISLKMGRFVLPFTTMDQILAGARVTLGPSLECTRRSLQAENERWLRLLEGTRIFCLSEHHDSATMWSKFADNHHGAVLGFSTTGDGKITAMSEVRRVRYSSEPAVVADRRVWLGHAMGIAPIDLSDIAERIIYTKAVELSDEREWRCWQRAETAEGSISRYDLFPFRASELAGIYLGRDITEPNRRALLDVAGRQATHVEVWQAVPGSSREEIAFTRAR